MRNIMVVRRKAGNHSGKGNRLPWTGLWLTGSGLSLLAIALGQVLLPLLERGIVTFSPSLMGVETVAGAALTAAGFVCMVAGAAALEHPQPLSEDQTTPRPPADGTPSGQTSEQLTHPG